MPTVAFVGEDFVMEAQMIAKSRGVLLKYVVFPRTINTMTPEEIKVEATRACEEAVRLLSKPA